MLVVQFVTRPDLQDIAGKAVQTGTIVVDPMEPRQKLASLMIEMTDSAERSPMVASLIKDCAPLKASHASSDIRRAFQLGAARFFKRVHAPPVTCA